MFVMGMRRLRGAGCELVGLGPLVWFRIGLASVLLAQALSLVGHLDALYGRHGIIDESVQWVDPPPGVPNVASITKLLERLGAPAGCAVPLIFAGYVGGLLGLLVGWHTRLAAALAWVAHTTLFTSSYMSSYGVDMFAHIGLFYCTAFPLGPVMSLDRGDPRSTFAGRLSLRVLQLHVCVIYTASGVEKSLGQQWWNGEAIWRALMDAPLGCPFDCTFLASMPWLAKVVCWTTLLLEAGVIGFVWHPRLRRLWLVGIVGMHLGIALALGLWTFSATMIVFDVAAFGFPGRAEKHGA